MSLEYGKRFKESVTKTCIQMQDINNPLTDGSCTDYEQAPVDGSRTSPHIYAPQGQTVETSLLRTTDVSICALI